MRLKLFEMNRPILSRVLVPLCPYCVLEATHSDPIMNSISGSFGRGALTSALAVSFPGVSTKGFVHSYLHKGQVELFLVSHGSMQIRHKKKHVSLSTFF